VHARIEKVAQALAADRPSTTAAGRQDRGAEQHHPADALAWKRRADATGVRAHEILLQADDLRRRDPHLGKCPKSRVDPVDGRRRIAAGDHRVDDLTSECHRGSGSGAHGYRPAVPRHRRKVLQGQRLFSQDKWLAHDGMCNTAKYAVTFGNDGRVTLTPRALNGLF
jgi:hypothetical protein